MFIDIFDVGHGGCSVVTCPNGTRVMIDCGFRLESPPRFPSVAFKRSPIDLFVPLNLDEDHLGDLPYLWRDVPIRSIFSNPTVDADALGAMKRIGGMGQGVRMMHSILECFGPGLTGRMADSGAVRAWAYFNRYGAGFSDTNNLSLAVFIRYGKFTILFAGDLEVAGWRTLLRLPAFGADLASVTVFIASHHGRKNGCCEEVFRFCRPEIFVISDAEHRYASQDTTDWYRWRARGIPALQPWPSSLQQRFVLTTRREGTIHIGVQSNGRYLVIPERPAPELNSPNWPFAIAENNAFTQLAALEAALFDIRPQRLPSSFAPLGLRRP